MANYLFSWLTCWDGNPAGCWRAPRLPERKRRKKKTFVAGPNGRNDHPCLASVTRSFPLSLALPPPTNFPPGGLRVRDLRRRFFHSPPRATDPVETRYIILIPGGGGLLECVYSSVHNGAIACRARAFFSFVFTLSLLLCVWKPPTCPHQVGGIGRDTQKRLPCI